MERGGLPWKKIGAAVLAAFVFQSSMYGMPMDASAQELSASQDLLEYTAQELLTEDSDAAYAHLKIGDWLDYGDYGIEREDIPGTDYFFYLTTKNAHGDTINDEQLAYCVQSYFLTPLPGEHSADMTDNVSAVGGSQNLHKVIYYGYGGAGYDREEFESLLEEKYPDYFADVYSVLSEKEQEEVSYILTHGAASYAYFTDGTPLEKYLELQFELRFGEDWEKPYKNFIEEELCAAGIEDGDLNLMGATYGMNRTGISIAKDWYEILSKKEMPGLEMEQQGDVYTFQGNEKNDDLTLTFAVPEDFSGTVMRRDGKTEQVQQHSEVTLLPEDQISFRYTGEASATEKDTLADLNTVIEGVMSGAEEEAWNLVVLQTSKGTAEKISKRQQDIAGVSLTDAGRAELSFTVAPEIGNFTLRLEDEEGLPVVGAAVGIYYDETGENPVKQEEAEVTLTTDENGEAYFEFAVNQQIEENGGKLYVKQKSAPTGNVLSDEVYAIGANESLTITNARETMSVSGSVDMKLPDGISAPLKIAVGLHRNGELIDTKTITEKENWSYEWNGLPKYGKDRDGVAEEYAYEVEVTAPDGYAVTQEDGKIIVHEAKPAELVIEAQVNVTGRRIKDGEFTFELTQVTDETGKSPVSDGITDTAVNDAQGKVVFDEVRCPQPGTYYFMVSSENETWPVKAEVKTDSANTDQLVAEITYPDGEPLFEKTYEASGEARIDGIRVLLENAELAGGEFTFELRGENGETICTGTNDAQGNIGFDPIAYTQDDIGKEYVYSVVQSEGGEEGFKYDTEKYEVTVKIEDSENSDGTLKITVSMPEIVFKNSAVLPERDSERAEDGSKAEDSPETASEAEADTEAASEAENNVHSDGGIVLPIGIAGGVLMLLAAVVWYVRRRKNAG